MNKKQYIYNLIKNNIFINLNENEYNQIIKYLFYIIEYIILRFSINETDFDDFWHQIKQNNNRDIIALFNLLFPYIDDKEGSFSLHKQIYYISDISSKKNDNIHDESKNKYIISNIQYNLYNKSEVDLTMGNINSNFGLLLETIDRVSNKLFINWLNIVPLTLTNYKKSNLYQNSIQLTEGKLGGITLENNKKKYWRDWINTLYLPADELTTGNSKTLSNNYKFYDLDPDNSTYNINKENLSKNKGIAIGDIFNTLYYDLFMDIVKIKWLIYEDTFDKSNNDEIYIKKFNELIGVPGLYNNLKWNELDLIAQNIFTSKWNNFIDIATSKYNKNKRNGFFYLLFSIIVFFERNYDQINSIVKNYNYIKITTDQNIDIIDDDDGYKRNNDDDDSQISGIELADRISKIPHEDIYTYLLETIQKFLLTWYGKNIVLFYDQNNPNNLNNNKPGITLNGLDNIKFNYDSYISEHYIHEDNFINIEKSIENKRRLPFNNINIKLPETLTVKYKFFYNFAKAFVLVYFNNKPHMRASWYNMPINDRMTMLKLLNLLYNEALEISNTDPNVSNHLNVMSFTNYYKRTYSDYDIFSNVKNLGNYLGHYMFQFIKDKLIDIVFECHIMKGLLGEFKCDKYLTDNQHLGESYDEKKKNQFKYLQEKVFIKDKLDDYNNNAFYFLTDKPYSELNEIYRGSKKNYFELLSSDYRWYSFYSMDWVSQINFFHRYINNRVIYVTGATGQGKSTQIPKMFLYGLKMIDKKSDGKVICSQPRVNPTVGNSEQISWELGVPITEISSNHNQKIKTFNPYIQYQTQNDTHIVEPHNKLLLKLVTDRLLYMELLKSPIFKSIERTQNQNNTSDGVEFNIYRKENLYDIIMVDESHEHNLNMDLVLTIARDTVRVNNSLKLVIVSATMAEDEPIYRRYYKEIDDNFAYPYNFYNAELNFDRNYVDRRMHISPPGETTQHKVEDIYLDFEPNDYPAAEIIALDTVLKIATDPNSKGDILLFSLSTEDIKKICKYINSNLPLKSDFICLPFFRELPAEWMIFNELSKKS